jgi:hypothetical protein
VIGSRQKCAILATEIPGLATLSLRTVLKYVPRIFESKCVGVAVTTSVEKAAFPFLSKITFIEMEYFSETFTYGIKFYNSKACSPRATTTSGFRKGTLLELLLVAYKNTKHGVACSDTVL